MQTKLTLRLEKQLIEQAKSHVKRSGKSLSQLVADYFAQLDRQPQPQELPPLTAALKGALKMTGVDKQDYQAYLQDKHR